MATPLIKTQTFSVTGMSCASCAAFIESTLAKQPGIDTATVNYAGASAQISFNPQLLDISQTLQTVKDLGYQLIPEQENSGQLVADYQQHELARLKKQTLGAALFTLPVVVLSMFFMDYRYSAIISLLLTLPVLAVFGRSFYINAWKQARHLQSNMDTLVALSTGIAFIFSVFNVVFPHFWHQKGLHAHVYFEAAAVVITFILLGRLLEQRAKAGTGSAIRKLMGLQPSTVQKMMPDGSTLEVPIEQIQSGDQIRVRPGERIAVDGKVVSGYSFIDESSITGEPVAVEKQPDALVYAGTINQQGSFTLRTDKAGKDTLLAHIIDTVRKAQDSRAPVQQTVNRIASIFVPVVIVLSLLTLFSWIFFGGENGVTIGLMAMATVLVIACPCALGLATPTAIMAGMGKGAENGLLIKDAESLELACKVNVVLLDKTGTLTQGKPDVTDFEFVATNAATDELMGVLLAAEQQSEHPLAEAVVRYLNSEKAAVSALTHFENLPGKGIHASSQTRDIWVGNLLLMNDAGVVWTGADLHKINQYQQQGKTVVLVAYNRQPAAIIALADRIKPNSAKAIQLLKKQGIEVHLLTGDQQASAEAIARELGIAHVRARMLPADKAEYVTRLQQQGFTVAMVGDGINDSEALARADVSIAMGRGADIAMDVAQMTLISSDLMALPKALRLSKLTVSTIHQNLFWAFIYNVVAIPLAAGILIPFTGFMINPMIAGAAMTMSSISVVSNSLRLKIRKLER